MAWRKRNSQLKELAEGLVKVGALQFGTFTLPDGSDSPYYVNLRGLPSYPGVFSLVIESMGGLVKAKDKKADAICGVPMTGLTIASPVAAFLKMPLIYTRPGKPGEKALVGEMMPDWDVVVMDDLTNSGKSVLAAAKSVAQEGGSVSHAVVLVDRLEGAREALSRRGVSLHAVTDILELADTLHSMELITQDNLKAITKSVGRRQ